MTAADVVAAPPKSRHPLPVLCWAWPVGGTFLILMGGICLWYYFHRFDPPPVPREDAPKPLPPNDPGWNTFLIVTCAGLFNGIAAWVVWYRFTLKRALTRSLWCIGLGIILTSAVFFLLTGCLVSALLSLVVLGLWVQRLTRQQFDWS